MSLARSSVTNPNLRKRSRHPKMLKELAPKRVYRIKPPKILSSKDNKSGFCYQLQVIIDNARPPSPLAQSSKFSRVGLKASERNASSRTLSLTFRLVPSFRFDYTKKVLHRPVSMKAHRRATTSLPIIKTSPSPCKNYLIVMEALSLLLNIVSFLPTLMAWGTGP